MSAATTRRRCSSCWPPLRSRPCTQLESQCAARAECEVRLFPRADAHNRLPKRAPAELLQRADIYPWRDYAQLAQALAATL